MLARRRHPAGPNSLDALCKRYGIDNSIRIKHGALMDSLLLANVYVELLGERQATLGLGGQGGAEASVQLRIATARPRPEPLPPRLSRGRRSWRTASSSRRSAQRRCGCSISDMRDRSSLIA